MAFQRGGTRSFRPQLFRHLPALVNQAVALLAASQLVGNCHFVKTFFQQGIQDLVPELGAACSPGDCHKADYRFAFQAVTENLN